GSLKAAGNSQQFAISGSFEFDKALFDAQAKLSASYVKKGDAGKFSGSADLKIGKKITGIKSATINATIDDEDFTVKGKAITDIPGIKSVDLEVTVKDSVVKIAGEAELGKIPAVKSGKLKLNLDNSTGPWKLGGTVEAEPALGGLKGLSGSLSGTYQDGTVLIKGAFDFDNGGVFSGHFDAGATNGAVDKDGNLMAGGKASDSYKAFGNAKVKAKFGDKISGQVRLKLNPDGSVLIGGRVTMESADLFKRYPEGKASEKELVDLTTPKIPVPGLAISFGGVAIGLNLSMQGRVFSDAWIGPGTLSGVYVDVADFDPAKASLDTLSFSGGGNFSVPAYAGLGAGVAARLTLDAGVLAVGGKIGVDAKVGVEPKVGVDVKFTWNQADGLDVSGEATAKLTPILELGITGGVFAEATLVVKTITLWEHNFDGPKVKLDPGISLDAKLKAGYKSKTGVYFEPPEFGTPKIEKSDFAGKIFSTGSSSASTTNTETGEDAGNTDVCWNDGGSGAGAGTAEPDFSDQEDICRVMRKPAAGAQAGPVAKAEPSDPGLPGVSAPPGGGQNARAAAGAAAKPGLEEKDIERLGPGRPMDVATRGFFEQSLSADFAQVRIHADAEADRAAQRIDARAFTVGRRIVFAAGEYDPQSEAGKRLLAHELAHVVQQQDGVSRALMREQSQATGAQGGQGKSGAAGTGAGAQGGAGGAGAGNAGAGGGGDAGGGGAAGGLTTPGQITLDVLKLPNFKANIDHRKALYDAQLAGGNLYRRAAYVRGNPGQSAIWMKAAKSAAALAKIRAITGTQNRPEPYLVRPKKESGRNFDVGTPEQLADFYKRPNWNRSGRQRY
ncbi:MAG: DUF4157 domain-containing protein, partial [Rhodocyclaceae bacterium]|nr:DUF4157 domain-containing protein [Rhodocyclaceae bacterium]